VKVTFHVPRVLFVTEYQLLGWTVGEPIVLTDGTPAVVARWPGATTSEGVVIAGAENDVVGLKLVTTSGSQLAEFMTKWGSPEMTQWVLGELSNMAETGTDEELSKVFGSVTADFQATGGKQIVLALRPTE
jgi:hypothetical protein